MSLLFYLEPQMDTHTREAKVRRFVVSQQCLSVAVQSGSDQAGHFSGGNSKCLLIDGTCISFGRNETKYIKIHLKTSKTTKGMSVLCIPDAQAVCIVCLCVLEMRHWFGGSYNQDPDPYSQKAFHRWEHRSWISDQAPLVHKISLKGKTHEGSAPKVRRCSSSAKDIQINKVRPRRQRETLCGDLAHPGKVEKS